MYYYVAHFSCLKQISFELRLEYCKELIYCRFISLECEPT